MEEIEIKTKEELNALMEEVETLNRKLAELTEDELKEITGGFASLAGPVTPFIRDLISSGFVPEPKREFDKPF